MTYDYVEDWDDEDAYDEYDIIQTTYNNNLHVKVVDFQYNSKTAIWTVLEEVAQFFETMGLPDAVIYHLDTSEFDDGDCCITVIYSE